MSVLTCHLVLDACRRDYLTPERTPFLAELLASSTVASMHSPPGFTQRTAMFTGQHPDTSGNLQAFGYAPEQSPFRWVRRIGPLAALYRPRKVFYPLRMLVRGVSRRVSGQYHTDPAWIPGRFLPSFAPVEDQRPVFEPGALPATSLFDLCRERGRTFRYLAHPVSGDDADVHRRVLAAYAEPRPPDLVTAQFSDLDEGAHHLGPLVPDHLGPPASQTGEERTRMAEKLRLVDDRVRDVHAALERTGRPFRLVVVGDHGMGPVRRRVDVVGALRRTGLTPGRDYTVFVNSTLVNVWYETAEARRTLRDALAALPGGHVLTDRERAAHRLLFSHRRYGDDLWAADPGTLCWPDYFHVVEHRIQGMHGYLDKREEGTGVLAVAGHGVEARELGDRSLVDVFPTLCTSLGMPVPRSSEGACALART